MLSCNLSIAVLLRYTIFASVFQFIIPLLIIAGIYVLICYYLKVRGVRSTGLVTWRHLRLHSF